MMKWWSRFMMKLTPQSAIASGEQTSVAAWAIEHIGRDADRCTCIYVIPFLRVIVFEGLVLRNGALAVIDSKLEKSWFIGGLRTLPMKNWCE